MKIRKAELKDLSRIAEIFVFNNRINYFPIFHEEAYSFGEMQVVPMIDQYFKKEEILNRIYVYDDGIIRGFTEINGTEICKLYVDPCLQNNGVGHGLITFAIEIGQGITHTGTMDFVDIVAGIAGFLLMYIVLAIITSVISGILYLIKQSK